MGKIPALCKAYNVMTDQEIGFKIAISDDLQFMIESGFGPEVIAKPCGQPLKCQ